MGDLNGKPSRTTGVRSLLRGGILWRELDKFRPTLSDQDAGVSRSQIERVAGVDLG